MVSGITSMNPAIWHLRSTITAIGLMRTAAGTILTQRDIW